jgi:hypothetical protein
VPAIRADEVSFTQGYELSDSGLAEREIWMHRCWDCRVQQFLDVQEHVCGAAVRPRDGTLATETQASLQLLKLARIPSFPVLNDARINQATQGILQTLHVVWPRPVRAPCSHKCGSANAARWVSTVPC